MTSIKFPDTIRNKTRAKTQKRIGLLERSRRGRWQALKRAEATYRDRQTVGKPSTGRGKVELGVEERRLSTDR